MITVSIDWKASMKIFDTLSLNSIKTTIQIKSYIGKFDEANEVALPSIEHGVTINSDCCDCLAIYSAFG